MLLVLYRLLPEGLTKEKVCFLNTFKEYELRMLISNLLNLMIFGGKKKNSGKIYTWKEIAEWYYSDLILSRTVYYKGRLSQTNNEEFIILKFYWMDQVFWTIINFEVFNSKSLTTFWSKGKFITPVITNAALYWRDWRDSSFKWVVWLKVLSKITLA